MYLYRLYDINYNNISYISIKYKNNIIYNIFTQIHTNAGLDSDNKKVTTTQMTIAYGQTKKY